MRRFLKWLHCMMAGHPMSVSHLECIEGQLYAVFETCSCGAKGRPDSIGLMQACRDAKERMDRLSGVSSYHYGQDTQ